MKTHEIEIILKKKVNCLLKKRRTDHLQGMMDAYEDVLEMIEVGYKEKGGVEG